MKLGSSMSRALTTVSLGLLLLVGASVEAKETSIRERFLRLGASLVRQLDGGSNGMCDIEFSDFLDCTFTNLDECSACDPKPVPNANVGEDCDMLQEFYDANKNCCANDKCGEKLEAFKECKSCGEAPPTGIPATPAPPTGIPATPAPPTGFPATEVPPTRLHSTVLRKLPRREIPATEAPPELARNPCYGSSPNGNLLTTGSWTNADGPEPTPGTGACQPNRHGTEPEPTPGTEPEPTPGTEPEPTPGTGPEPTPGTEPAPTPGSGVCPSELVTVGFDTDTDGNAVDPWNLC